MQRAPIIILVPMFITFGCVSEGAEDDRVTGTIEQGLALAEYSASVTNSAQDSLTTAQFPIAFKAGETMMIGTQGITEAAFSGDTFLRLRNSAGTDLATNNDHCGTLGSRLTYIATSAATHTIWAGCNGTLSCGTTTPNIIGISRRKAVFSFVASNTNNATINTINKQYYFNGGETIRASTCGLEATGASSVNDTFLRLYRSDAGNYTQVSSNDDDGGPCGCASASTIIFTVASAGFYQIRVGCWQNTSCNGIVAVYAE